MLHQTLPILGQLWQLFEVSQILEFLRYYIFSRTIFLIGYHACNAYIQVTGAGADYLLDHASLQMVANDLHWKTKAQARIEQIRKRDINIQ